MIVDLLQNVQLLHNFGSLNTSRHKQNCTKISTSYYQGVNNGRMDQENNNVHMQEIL